MNDRRKRQRPTLHERRESDRGAELLYWIIRLALFALVVYFAGHWLRWW